MDDTHQKLKFTYVQQTDKGRVRKFNEDYMGIFDVPNGKLFVLCDGMGGHLGGAMAAQLGVNAIYEYFQVNQYNISTALSKAILAANERVIKKAKANPKDLHNMGATCVTALVSDDKVYYAYAGDSRMYLLSGGQIRLMTKDHSYVQQLVDMELITAEEAKYHPRRNEITSALGFYDIRVNVCQDPIQPNAGDMLLLCSDGLNNMLEDNEIEFIMSDKKTDLTQKAKILIDRANLYGGIDNTTVQLIEIIS